MMQPGIVRAGATIFFAGLLATAAIVSRLPGRGRGTSGEPAGPTSAEAQARYGFALQDITRKAGIEFVHQAPTLDPALNPIMPEVASMGAAVSVVDFDRDGWPDLYVTNSSEG